MTKLLIVDDDRFIREGLIHLIDWDDLGIEIIGTSEGGFEALKLMEERKPDIVLTDIRMPQGNGLELIEQIRHYGWHTQIIVLSGYDDYTYVRKAMKFQIEDYLLKPVDAHELISIIKTCCEKQHAKWRSEQWNRESFQLLRDNVILRWMENRIDPDQLVEKLFFLGIDMRKYDLFQVGIITWQDWREMELSHGEQQFRSFAIVNSVDEALREQCKGIAFLNQNREIVCLLTGKSNGYVDAPTFANENLLWMQEIAKGYAPILKTPWFCTLGSVISQMQTVHMSYHDARHLQDYIHLTEGPKCVDNTYFVHKQKETPFGLAEREHLVTALLSGDRKLWTEAIGNDFQWASSQVDPLSAAKYAAIEWVMLSKLTLKQKNLPISEFLVESKVFQKLFARNEIGEIRNDLLQLLNGLENALQSVPAKKKNPIIEQVEQYIQERYAEELSLQILASRFNVNNTYLGRLFKEEIGEYFSDYLNRIRLDQAKKLLESTLIKVSEIARHIGYLDSNYFFRKFKLTTGLSPTEYRNLHTK